MKSQPRSWTPVERKGCPNGSTAQAVELIKSKRPEEVKIYDTIHRWGF